MSCEKTLLIIIPSLHVGGTETHLSQILPGLKAKGWDITVYLTSGAGELCNKLESAGIKICVPSELSQNLHNKNKLLRAPLIALRMLQLCWFLRRSKPKLVQFLLPEAYLLGSICCLITGQKNMIMSRRSLNNYQQKYPLLKRLENWLHTKMARIITNSQSNVEQIIAQENVPANKIELIYNGIDTKRFTEAETLDKQAIRNEFNLIPSALTLIVIANIIPYKGHATLLHTLNLIKQHLPADWQLLCVGKKHAYINELERLTTELNLTDHIHWLGQQQAIEKLLAISDIAISSSYEEGFSNAVLEAMAAGLPLIVTNVGGNPEAVQSGVNGLVVPPRDVTALGTAILQLANNKNTREQMGTAGKQKITEKYSLNSCVDKYDLIFSDCIK